MKKYNRLLVILCTFALMLVLSWILPETTMSEGFVEGTRNPAGLLDVLNLLYYALYYFWYVFFFVLAIGGLYGILNKIPAYRLLLDKIVNIAKGKEKWFFLVTVFLTAAIVSITGFTFDYLIAIPFIAAIILMLGYDKITAALVTVGSISVGIIGNTFSGIVVGTFNQILETDYSDMIWVKVIMFALSMGLLLLNIWLHLRKTERTTKIEENIIIPKKEKAGTQKVWPLATILGLLFLAMIVGNIDWTNVFNVTFFTDFYTTLTETSIFNKYIVLGVGALAMIICILYKLHARKNNKESKKAKVIWNIVMIVLGLGILFVLLKIILENVCGVTDVFTKFLEIFKFSKIKELCTLGHVFGEVTPFGYWSYFDYILAILVTVIVLKFVYKIKVADTFEAFLEGNKKFFNVSMVAILVYLIILINVYHPVLLTILKPLLTVTDGFNLLLFPISTLISAIFNIDLMYYTTNPLTLDYVVSYITNSSVYSLTGVITQGMYGLAHLFAPTSVVLLGTLSILDIPYQEWLKKSWKLILELFALLMIIFIIVFNFVV